MRPARHENVISRIRLGVDAIDDQVRHLMGKRVRLPGAGPGDYEQRRGRRASTFRQAVLDGRCSGFSFSK